MTIAFAATWLALIVPLVCSPGPGNILCVVSGAANGFRGSAFFIFGLNVSYASYSLLAGFGLGAVVREYPGAFKWMQLLGCAYLLWLALSFFRRKHGGANTTRKLTFRDGVISQALNFKGVSIVLVMHSQFLAPESEVVVRVLLLTLMLTILNLCNHFFWAYCGALTARQFVTEKSAKIQNIVYGIMLIAVAIWLLPVWD